MNRNIFSVLFFLTTGLCLMFGFNNCDSREGTVVSILNSGSAFECMKSVNQKVSTVSYDSLGEVSFFLTPPDGDWTDHSRDPNRSDQVYLDALAADEAHQIVYNGISSMEPVVVAVIDSGVNDDHPDLTRQMYRDQNGEVVGYDFFNADTDAMDDDGHGTHVAGLIAAEGHNDEGIRGGAPEFVRIMPIKSLGLVPLDDSQCRNRGLPPGCHVTSLPSDRLGELGQAVRYAVDRGADIINMSLGMTVDLIDSTTDPDQFFAGLKTALQYAVGQGVVVVIASGNDNVELNNKKMTYPAKFGSEINGVITVGAYDVTDKTISPFSNFSPVYVEVQAPGSMNRGQGLLSTWLGNGYKTAAGTSMATPLTAGLVALAKIYLKQKGVDLTASQIEDLVKESSFRYQSLVHLAQEGRVISYKNMVDRLVQIYESGIIEHPKDLKLTSGQTGRLAIRINDFSSQLQFQWYHNGERISGANQIEFLVRDVMSEDEGDYHVQVRLESGEMVPSLKATVEIVEDPCG